MKKLLSITAAAIMLFAGCSRNEVLVTPQESGTPIDFGTYVGRAPQTKGTSLDLDVLKTESFGVYAFYNEGITWENYSDDQRTSPKFMDNIKVYWAGAEDDGIDPQGAEPKPPVSTEWKYDDIKYWPEDGEDVLTEINFFAYAPYREGAGEWNDKDGTIPFALAVDDEDAVDIKNLEDLVYDAASVRYWNDKVTGKKAADDAAGIAISERLNQMLGGYRIRIQFKHALSRIGFSASVDAPNRNVAIIGK